MRDPINDTTNPMISNIAIISNQTAVSRSPRRPSAAACPSSLPRSLAFRQQGSFALTRIRQAESEEEESGAARGAEESAEATLTVEVDGEAMGPELGGGRE